MLFENVRGVLEMTAHLGKALRRGSLAEPAHDGVDDAHLSQTVLGRKKLRGFVLAPWIDFWDELLLGVS